MEKVFDQVIDNVKIKVHFDQLPLKNQKEHNPFMIAKIQIDQKTIVVSKSILDDRYFLEIY